MSDEGLEISVPTLGAAPLAGGGPGFQPLADTDDSGTSDDAHHGPDDDSTDSEDLDPAERRPRRKERKERRKRDKQDLQRKWDEGREKVRAAELRKVAYEREWKLDQSSRVILREFAGATRCQGVSIVEGFPSKGLASNLVAKTIVDELKLPLVGEIASLGYTSSIRISHGNPMHATRIYGDERIVVFVSELLVDDEVAYAMAQAVIDFAQRHAAPWILCVESLAEEIDLDIDEEEASEMTQEQVLKRMLGAIELAGGSTSRLNKDERKQLKRAASLKFGSGSEPSTPELRAKEKAVTKELETKAEAKSEELTTMFVATSDTDVAKLLDMGLHRVKNGIMSGVTGLVLAEAAVAVGVEAIALVGRHHPMLSDARAAVACLEVISRLVPGAGLAGGQLTRRAEKLERKIHRAVSDMTRTSRRRAPQSMYM